MADNTKHHLTAYDIECLLHVYNKFVLWTMEDKTIQPVTDIEQIFGYTHYGDINLNLDQYIKEHPNTLSEELASLLGESTDTLISIQDIRTKLRTYCDNNCNPIYNTLQEFSVLPNAPLMQLLGEAYCYKYRNKYHIRDSHYINEHRILCGLIKNRHIKMCIPDSNYVLK
jgi:hypothetical protein